MSEALEAAQRVVEALHRLDLLDPCAQCLHKHGDLSNCAICGCIATNADACYTEPIVELDVADGGCRDPLHLHLTIVLTEVASRDIVLPFDDVLAALGADRARHQNHQLRRSRDSQQVGASSDNSASAAAIAGRSTYDAALRRIGGQPIPVEQRPAKRRLRIRRADR